jgi:hypothetical protein
MARQFSATLRNAMGNVYESTLGTSPQLDIRTGSAPATPETANSGSSLWRYSLPSDWYTAFASGSANINSWTTGSAQNTGTAGHYRFYTSGSTCHEQGTVGVGAGDFQLDSLSFTAGQTFTLTYWQTTMGNV